MVTAGPVDPSDAELLHRVAQRDQQAFLALYDRYSGPMFGAIRKVLRSEHDASETLQTVMLEVWERHASRYNPVLGEVKFWMLRLARSRAIDRVRTNASRAAASLSPGDHTHAEDVRDLRRAPDARRVEADALAASDLRRAVDSLDDTLRAPVLMAFAHGMRREDIAQHLGIPVGTVKTRIRKAVSLLRESLGAVGAGREGADNA